MVLRGRVSSALIRCSSGVLRGWVSVVLTGWVGGVLKFVLVCVEVRVSSVFIWCFVLYLNGLLFE